MKKIWKATKKKYREVFSTNNSWKYMFLTAAYQISALVILIFLDNHNGFYRTIYATLASLTEFGSEVTVSLSIMMIIAIYLFASLVPLFIWKKADSLACFIFMLMAASSLHHVYSDLFENIHFDIQNGIVADRYIKTKNGFVFAQKVIFHPLLGERYKNIDKKTKEEIYYFEETGKHRSIPDELNWYYIDDKDQYHFSSLPGKVAGEDTYYLRLDEKALDRYILTSINDLPWSEAVIKMVKQEEGEKKIETPKPASADREKVPETKPRVNLESGIIEKETLDSIQLIINQEPRGKIDPTRQKLLSGNFDDQWLADNTSHYLVNNTKLSTYQGSRVNFEIMVSGLSFYKGLLVLSADLVSLSEYTNLSTLLIDHKDELLQIYDRDDNICRPKIKVTGGSFGKETRKGDTFKLKAICDQSNYDPGNILNKASFSILNLEERRTIKVVNNYEREIKHYKSSEVKNKADKALPRQIYRAKAVAEEVPKEDEKSETHDDLLEKIVIKDWYQKDFHFLIDHVSSLHNDLQVRVKVTAQKYTRDLQKFCKSPPDYEFRMYDIQSKSYTPKAVTCSPESIKKGESGYLGLAFANTDRDIHIRNMHVKFK